MSQPGGSWSRSPTRGSSVVGIVVACVLAVAGTAHADRVLVYQTRNLDPQGGDQAGTEAAAVLTGLGHDVTLLADFAPTLPADLSAFDTIWVIQVPAISGSDQARLVAYANGGGGLYLTGERSCCASLNASVQAIAANLLRTPVPTIGSPVIEGGDLFMATAPSPFGITSTPNPLPQWQTMAAGVIPSGVDPSRVVFENATHAVGAAVYPPEDFQHGAGCLYIAMDLTFWQPEVAPDQDLSLYAENLEQFLTTCADADHDGLSDVADAAAGADPHDPDTDGDGLCDGYATVPGVCIDGEHPRDDWDEDGILPPLDTDDDDDGIPTAFETQAEIAYPNVDGDMIPAWNDHDSDNDGFDDVIEGTGDYDGDGIPAIVDGDDYPSACSEDVDCGGATSGLVCNLTEGYCRPGCRGTGGNGCPAGATCSSTDATIGTCGGGGSDAGSIDGGAPADGGAPIDGGRGSGADATARSDGGAAAAPPASGGCGCRLAGGSAGDARAAFLVVGLALLALRRRRRAR